MRGDASLLHNPIFLILSVYLNPKNSILLCIGCAFVSSSVHILYAL